MDIEAARKEGYSDSEIVEYLGKQRRVNLQAARQGGYSDAEILAHLTGTKPKPETSLTEKAKGVGEAALSMASAIPAFAAGAVSGVARGMVSGIGTQEGVQAGQARAKQVQEALTYQPRTELGKEYLGKVGGALEESKLGGMGPTEAIGLAGAAPKGLVASRAAKLAGEESKNLVRDTTRAEAQAAGMRIPPSSANPSMFNNLIEGVAGKIKTAQKASEYNQPEFINKSVRQALGLPEDAHITRESIAAIRQQAGQAYEAVKNTGTIKADKTYFDALDNIAKPYKQASKDFPGRANTQVIDAVNSLKRRQFDSGSAVEQVKSLREEADKAYRTGDKAFGKSLKGAANALDEQIGRHVAKIGNPDLLKQYQTARETIAKTYTVDKALNESTGNVSARVLANELKKGRPLSGELKTVAKAAREFPKALQEPEKIGSPTSVSIFDAGLGTIPAAMSGHLGWLAGVLGRPMLRSALMSGPGQKALAGAPSYTPGAAFTMGAGAAEAAPFAAAPLPLAGAVEGRQMGGPVTPGKPYIVGEAGPEMIVPQSHGTVIPLADAMSMQEHQAYKQAIGASIYASERPQPMTINRGGQEVMPIPPNLEGLAQLLVKSGRATDIMQARKMVRLQ